MTAAVTIRGLHISLGGQRIVEDLDLDVVFGEWLAIIGPNGAGKSTLLRALAGLVPWSGRLEVAGVPERADARALARAVALVPQSPVVPTGMTVSDYVLLGRTPHVGFFGVESATDLDVAHDALANLELVHLAGRALTTLSGGERQRVLVARALAQATPLLLLDEPTTALDVGHQQDVLDLIDDLRHQRGLTVVTVMHDLTLAGQYADRLALLTRGRPLVTGAPAEVLDEALLSDCYGARVRVIEGPDGPIVVPARAPGESPATVRVNGTR